MHLKSLVIAFIALIGFTAVGQQELTLSDAVMGQYRQFYPKSSIMVNWIPNTKTYSFLSGDYQTLKMSNVKKASSTDLITTAELAKLTGQNFGYVKVLEWKDENSFYTESNGKYFLVNVATKTSKALGELPEDGANSKMHAASGHIAYTIDNNLYLQTNENKQIQVTNAPEDIVSGQAIARSEFGITDGIFWSNSGDYLGFYQKDESQVADYPLLDITTPTGSLKNIKYPMAGQASEKSAAGIYSLKTGKTVYIKPTGDEEDYITNFGWGPNDKFFYVAEVNRDQNHTKVIKYNAETGELVKVLFEEKNDKWTEPEHPVYFVNDNQFVWMSERDGFMNLYLYSDEGELVKQLTTNKWVAQDIVGHTGETIYFKGTGESPLETNYFSVNLAGEQTQLTKGGTHSVSFSSDYKYMFDQMNSTTVPNVETICDTKGKMIREVMKADNPYTGVTMGTAEYGTIKAGDDKTDLHYRLIKPSNFDETKKYPVLVYVYGGPHAQLVTDSWLGGASLWMYWMAEQGYLVYTVDNRGSANRGFEFESVIHRQLGTAEMEDQLKGVEHLKSMPFVDGDRLAVHGWSFGGFMTTSLMLREAGVFNAGVAGGPVTDWSYYEIMYGERYMDRPEQNVEGYKENRLMNYVNKLEGKLLLIHGTIDDVVVMQHNLGLVKAFIDEGIQMDFFPYPMHPHNVRGKDRVHLMEKVLTYVIENNK
ncbi:MAG: DPP IV N-terminal domain-containing protein [Crocinitomicaceae bacterium]